MGYAGIVDPDSGLGQAFGMNTETPTSPTGDRAWPELRASRTEPCDGSNPDTGQPCVLGWHSGYHREASGQEWLDS